MSEKMIETEEVETDVEFTSVEEIEKRDIPRLLICVLYFPFLFVYLEMVFHFYMKMNPDYLLQILPFGLSVGLLCSPILLFLPKKLSRILQGILTFFFSLLYVAELVCKSILQQYYQFFSVMSTAANNKLTDYKDAIIEGITKNIVGILILLLPIAFYFVTQKWMKRNHSYHILSGILSIFLGIMIHIGSLLILQGNWQGDFTPKMLYHMDTNVDDQVEQLGIFTMLRLDVKHTLFGINREMDTDFVKIPTYQQEPGTLEEQEQIKNTESASTELISEVEEVIVPELDTSPNIMEIDFESLLASAENKDQEWLASYFQNQEPTLKNEYTGMFAGYNLIFLTAEGFSKYVIDPVRTPTLYKMSTQGFVFENYYTALHYTSTSGGEFQNLVGLYPKNGNPISLKETGIQQTSLPFTLAHQLKNIGYRTIGYHNNANMYGRNLSHPNLGYEWIQGKEGFEMEKNSSGNNVWPQSDLYMVQQTMDDYINEEHFHAYYLTVSGHMPYNFTGDSMAVRNKAALEATTYSNETKAYLAANMEVEKALTYLVEQLEAAGKAENTLIVLSPDHIPYFDVDIMEELSGKTFGGSSIESLQESDLDFDLYKSSLIIWSASMKEPVVVKKPCSQVDILPTISNLMGLSYDSRLLVGSDILSTAPGLVIFTSSSFLSDYGLYNRYKGSFTQAEGIMMSEEEQAEYISIMKKVVKNKLEASVLILEQDYYAKIFPKNPEQQEEIADE